MCCLLHSNGKPAHSPFIPCTSLLATPAPKQGCFFTPCYEHKFSEPAFSLWLNPVCPSKPHSNAPSSPPHPLVLAPPPLRSPTAHWSSPHRPALAPLAGIRLRATPPSSISGCSSGPGFQNMEGSSLGGVCGESWMGFRPSVRSLELLGEYCPGASALIRCSQRLAVLRRCRWTEAGCLEFKPLGCHPLREFPFEAWVLTAVLLEECEASGAFCRRAAVLTRVRAQSCRQPQAPARRGWRWSSLGKEKGSRGTAGVQGGFPCRPSGQVAGRPGGWLILS